MADQNHLPSMSGKGFERAGKGVEPTGKEDHLVRREGGRLVLELEKRLRALRCRALDEPKRDIIVGQKPDRVDQRVLSRRLRPESGVADRNLEGEGPTPSSAHASAGLTTSPDAAVGREDGADDLQKVFEDRGERSQDFRRNPLRIDPECRVRAAQSHDEGCMAIGQHARLSHDLPAACRVRRGSSSKRQPRKRRQNGCPTCHCG